jgi:signal transduction histidine kinase
MTQPLHRLVPRRGRRRHRTTAHGAAAASCLVPTLDAWAAQPGAGDGNLPLAVLAIAVAALGGLGLVAARRLFAAGRRVTAPAREAPSATPQVVLRGDAPPLPAAPPASPLGVRATTELDVFRRLSRDVYWEQDEHGVLTRVDDGSGGSPLKLRLGEHRWDGGAQPLESSDWEAHRHTIAQREPFSEFAWVWVDPAGRVRVAIDSGMPRFDVSGRFTGYAGLSRDAGAETVADRARRLAMAALLAAAEPVVWIEAGTGSPPGWHIIWANAAACRLFDRTERELRQVPCRALFGPDSQAAASSLEQSLRARRDARMHVDLARKYGEVRSVEVRLEPLPGESALRPCAALLMHDRSADQERLQQDGRAIERLRSKMRERSLELEVTAKELESFTYTVSHDLRAPIRVVEGFARILQEDYEDRLDRIGHDHLQRILSAASRMTQMIDALLGLSRLSGQPIVPEQVDLSRLADTIAEELRGADAQRRVSLRVQPGLLVEGDRTLLRVMLENLLGNAWKYTSKRPDAQIEFGCSGLGPDAVYCVADNGEGFDMRFADRLFGVFQRLHSASEFPGTGVGLATVQRVVRRHGGRVWAESEPGRGSRFYFTLWEKAGR